MHSSVQRARSARLHADTASLQDVSRQLASLEHERRAALEKVASLAADIQQLQRQKDFLASSVAKWRAAYSREFFATCPEELLCYIFRLLTDEPDANWSDGKYNHDRACLPFTISAVCVRWRQVALACPALWTYVGLPYMDHDIEDVLDIHGPRVDLLLLRSRSASLEVVLPWYNLVIGAEPVDDFILVDSKPASKLRAIFMAISCHVARWANVSLWTPLSFDRGLLHVFRGPTPALVELTVSCHQLDHWHQNPLDGFFPFAPRLRSLQLHFAGMLCSAVSAFPALSYLETGARLSPRGLTDFLTRCASTLETLYILICTPDNDASQPRLTLPRLRTLRAHGLPYFVPHHSPPLLVTPGLKELVLNKSALKPVMDPFLSTAASTVTRLTLEGPITAANIQPLSVLSNLTHFAMAVFRHTTTTSYTIDDDFFLELAGDGQRSVIWPKLRSISLSKGGAISYQDNDAGTNEGVGILRLVSLRNAIKQPQGEGRPCKLEEVVLQYDGVPAWLVAEIARLLSA